MASTASTKPAFRKDTLVFVAGALIGLLLWVFSKPLFGRSEPWDGRAGFYLLALLVAGIVLGAFGPNRPSLPYWAIYSGQAVHGVLAMLRGDGNLFPLGAIVLLVYSLPTLLGGYLGRLVYDALKPKR